MDLNKTLEKINQDRYKVEACFVFSCWNNPDLFMDYDVNEKILLNKDAQFYWQLGYSMFRDGIKVFDAITIDTYLSDKKNIRDQFEKYGGYAEVNELMKSINSQNVESYYDGIIKRNNLTTICKKYNELFEDIDRFKNATSEDIYNTFELLNNSVSLSTNEQIESLSIDDGFIDKLINGEDMGYNYSKYCPLLNYITLGASPGLYMIGGHSGTGKSSFVFGSMLLGLHYKGINTAIISNEMGVDTYKVLLLEHILIHELNYWKLTRKQLRMGNWNDEQKEMVKEAMKISEEKYSNIKFIKLYNNDPKKILKYFRKLKSLGISVILYDTFKSDDNVDKGLIWQSLLLDSRKLDSVARKAGICCITTYQLALHTLNQRYLDASCLSNAKQIKEVYETMIYMRPVWDDEFDGEKYDIRPWKFNKDNSKIKEKIKLDPEKKYMLCFVDKTRADEDKKVLIYEWLGHFNHWKELGFARVINDHKIR